jgi:DNA-binding MurR/RpiR family transcriptional regulator
MEVVENIKNKFTEMTPLQKKLGHYIIDHIDRVAFLSISELAQLNNVSDATVFKFTKLLGYDGYTDFARSVRKNVHSRLSSDPEDEPVPELSLSDKIISKEISNLSSFRKSVQSIDLDNCIKRLATADYISVIGLMSASPLGHVYSHMLMQLFPDVTNISNLDVYAYSALNRLTDKSVALVLSFPRYPMIVEDLTKSMKKKHVFQIGVTNSHDSPVAKYADVLVTTPFELSSIQTSMTAPLVFLNILIAGLLDKYPERFADKLQNYDKYFTDFYNLMHKF